MEDGKDILDFDKLVTNYIKKEERPREIGVYFPSELSFCLRRNYYLYTQTKPLDDDTARVFEVGNIFHEFMDKVVKDGTFDSKAEKSLVVVDTIEELVISGRLDNLVVVKQGDQPIVLEFKSTRSLNYVNEAKHEHILQIQPYLKTVRAKTGLIVYIEKDSLKVKQFKIEYDPKLFLELMNRARRLHRSLMDKRMPEAEAKKNPVMSWMCNYCAFKEECDAVEAGSRSLFDEKKRKDVESFL